MKSKIYNIVLQSISNLFHPLLMLTYAAILIVYLSDLSLLVAKDTALVIVCEVFILTCFLPVLCISILYKLGFVGHWALRNRTDRAIPLLVNWIFYVLCTCALNFQGFPKWALAFYIGASILAFICWFVSFWWKISAHASGLAGLMVVSFSIFFRCPYLVSQWIPLIIVVITGLVCSIRVYLGRHTLAQVTVGAIVGTIIMSLSYVLWG